MTDSRTLGDAIRSRRLQLGISQEDLAERIGGDVRQSDVSRLERGKILFPRLERLNQIAMALEMSLGELLTEAGWFADEPPAVRLTSSSQAATIRGSSIVVADDEPVSLDAIVALLADYGYSTTTAYDLTSLLTAIETSRPDIVITDIALPGIDANAITARFSDEFPAICLVFMGLGLPNLNLDVPYLEKPIDWRQLVALVASLGSDRSMADDRLN